MKKAVFIDRDGTIIEQVALLHKAEDVVLLPGAKEALRELHDMDYFVVLATNQPVVARGVASEEDMNRVHEELQRQLGGLLDAIYACPHHPDADDPRYRKICDCRKPEIGMITKAAQEHDIDLAKSFMVGDTTRDTLAGNRAKLITILVETGEGGKDVWQFDGKPDFVAKNLADAVTYIRTHSKL